MYRVRRDIGTNIEAVGNSITVDIDVGDATSAKARIGFARIMRAVVACVAHAVTIGIILVSIGDLRAVVDFVGHTIAVTIQYVHKH